MGPRSAEKGAYRGRQTGEKSVNAGRRQEAWIECNIDMKSRKQEYYRTRGAAKNAHSSFFKTKNAERMKFFKDLVSEDGKGNVFRLATQLVSKTQKCCECKLCEG